MDQVQDFKMPEKIVTRLLKESLPEDVTLSKTAKNSACRIAGIFILQLSILAADRARLKKRRTLDNKDIIEAAAELGLAEHAPQLVRFGAQRKRNARRKESNIQKSKSKRNSSSARQDSHMLMTDMTMDSNAEISETPDREANDFSEDRADQDTVSSHDGDSRPFTIDNDEGLEYGD